MKESQRSIYLLLSAFLIIVVSLLYFFSLGPGSWNPSGKLLKLHGSDNISRIILSGSDQDTLQLEKDHQGYWLLGRGYRANEASVKDLIFIAENLTLRAPVPVSEREGVSSQIASAGLKLEIYARIHRIRFGGLKLFPHIKRTASLLISENPGDNTSVYVLLAGSSNPLVAHLPGYRGRPWLAFEPDRQHWQDPVVINAAYEDIRQVKVNVSGSDDESYVLDNDPVLGIRLKNASGAFLEETEINMHLVERFLHSFNDLFYERLIAGGETVQMGKSIYAEPFIEVVVRTTEGRKTRIKCFRKAAGENMGQPFPALTDFDPDRFYMQVDDDYFVLAQYLVFGRVLRPLSFFRINDTT